MAIKNKRDADSPNMILFPGSDWLDSVNARMIPLKPMAKMRYSLRIFIDSFGVFGEALAGTLAVVS